MATDSKMQIEYIKLEQIKPYERNPRKNDEAVKYVKQSIKEFGFKVPIVLDKDNVIVAGHTRYKASKELGLKEVPCIHADDLNVEQIKAFRLADNKVSEFAEWDDSLLNLELDSLEMDMTDFGFLDSVFEEPQEIIEDEVSEDVEPLCKLGDVWQLGNHRLMCGDATNENDVEKLTGGVRIDLVFTDPPYGMNAVSKSGVLSQKYKTDILNDDNNEVAIKAFKLLKEKFDNAYHVWWGANYYTECLPSSECWVVWDKNNDASDQTDCELAWSNFRSVVRQFTMTSEKVNRVHPTQKPCNLFAQILEKFDKKNEFKTVLDLFGGSGSTLIACEQLNRKCYMMELDPHYCDVIINRWETLTGDKATLLESK